MSEEELPNYESVGGLGAPPEYKNTDSAAGYRTIHEAPPDATNQEGAPPSYESMYGQIKDEWLNSETFAEFLRKLGAILLASLACTLLLIMFILIPIAYIVIGVLYINDCPINKWIPIYLIVAGLLGLLQNSLMLIKKQIPIDIALSIAFKCLEIGIGIIAFIWFILGTIWVYSIMTDVCWNKQDKICYCHKVCYLFAFWMITITYILIIILILILCIFVCCTLKLFQRRQIEQTQDSYETMESSDADDLAAGFTAGFTAGLGSTHDPYQGVFLGDSNSNITDT